MAVTFNNIVYTGDNQQFFEQLIRDFRKTQEAVAALQTEVSYLKGRVQ